VEDGPEELLELGVGRLSKVSCCSAAWERMSGRGKGDDGREVERERDEAERGQEMKRRRKTEGQR